MGKAEQVPDFAQLPYPRTQSCVAVVVCPDLNDFHTLQESGFVRLREEFPFAPLAVQMHEGGVLATRFLQRGFECHDACHQ